MFKYLEKFFFSSGEAHTRRESFKNINRLNYKSGSKYAEI